MQMSEQLNKIKIIYWNCNGLSNKIIELYNYMTTNTIHIACLSETFLKNESALPSDPEYLTYRHDREQSSKGGVALIIRRDIQHELLPSLDMKYIESIGIMIKSKRGEMIKIFSLYVPGTSAVADINQYFIRDLSKITRLSSSYFACGDFNAKHRAWNCNRANRAGTLLYDDMCSGNFFVEFPDDSTHIPVDHRKSPSTIDLLITNKLHDHSILTTEDLSSDHRSVSFTIDVVVKSDSSPRLFRDFAKADWDKFKGIIHRNISPQNLALEQTIDKGQIDSHIDSLTQLILTAQSIAIPLKSQQSHKLLLPDRVLELIKVKNALKRQWQRSRDQALKFEVNLRERIIKEEIKSIRNANWALKLEGIRPNDKSLWKTTKFLKKRQQFIPPLKIADKSLITKAEKANAIAETFENNHINPIPDQNLDFTNATNDKVTNYIKQIEENTPIDPTNLEEIDEIVKKLKNNKAPGPDKITNRLIKKLPKRGLDYIQFIINSCLRLNYFPTTWKAASVIPIPKPNKNRTDPASYRPISLLSSISKILEKVMLNRLQRHIDHHKIIPDEQCGFRKGLSTNHQIHRVISSAHKALASKKSTGLIALDIEKAYDRIWTNGLVSKMIELKFPPYLTAITHSFLSERTFEVNINGCKSTTRSVAAGVPQGAVLSPTLFSIYIHDFPLEGTHDTALFADDTAFYRSDAEFYLIKSSLTTAATRIENYMTRWKIKINGPKTDAVFISNRKSRELPAGPIKVFGADVVWKEKVKYLGVQIDKKLTFQHHIEQAIMKANSAIKVLYPLINRKSNLDIYNKILVYKLAIRPILVYGLPALGNIATSHIAKLQRTQSRALKMILNLPWFESTNVVHEMSNVPPINLFIEKLTRNFLSKLKP
jgi:hypothetical protein